ncbi:MAG: histidine triad nucleotide-binding protein [Deltaproteobacteria bacterium RBG_16_71_12]|nr:MAG: histidine triad nucleotide-binding protein [Deltaproteobacteria bacterium RBG_16_71_12]
MTSAFGKILRGEIPCKKVYEDDLVLAFDDVAPMAPVHVLIIPKQAVAGLNDVTASQAALLGHLLATAKKVAELKGVANSGYRVVVNSGADGGQSVFHLHLHVLGGRQLGWPPG